MGLDHLPMRHEPVFDADGTYQQTVEGNVLLHQEAAAVGSAIVAEWLPKRGTRVPIRVLDLACGGKPVIIAAIMAAFPTHQFAYTGVDLNRDQLDRIRGFAFPPNVQAEILEGDVWSLDTLPFDAPFDLVFIGLNTHHAVPEELSFAAQHIARHLRPDGLFLNHDLFRPERFAYLRRPDVSPTDPSKHLRAIPVEKLRDIRIPIEESRQEWREEFLRLDAACLRTVGIHEAAIDITLAHIRERDFPVSTEEMTNILRQAGFRVVVHDYQRTDHPLRDYLALVAAYQSE